LRVERFSDVSELNALMDMLERRVSLLGVLRTVLSGRDVLVRIGAENDAPALRSLALVAAAYGLPQRNLGAVSVIGPLRMDYGQAIRSVREAASQLSTFVADVYDER
jgi:heat-inducible transcriptional repressor